MSMYFAVLLKVDVSDESQIAQKAFEVILLVLHAGIMVIIFTRPS